MTGLIIEFTGQQHQHIKALAALQGKTIREYALERWFDFTSDEHKAMQEVKALLVPRIEEGSGRHRAQVEFMIDCQARLESARSKEP